MRTVDENNAWMNLHNSYSTYYYVAVIHKAWTLEIEWAQVMHTLISYFIGYSFIFNSYIVIPINHDHNKHHSIVANWIFSANSFYIHRYLHIVIPQLHSYVYS